MRTSRERLAPSWLRLLCLVAGVLLYAGATCDGSDLVIVAPGEGAVVTTSSVAIEVQIDPEAYEVPTLSATLNGVPLTLAGGPSTWTANVPAGAPLLDECLLLVSATAKNGVTVTQQRRFQYAPPNKARAPHH